MTQNFKHAKYNLNIINNALYNIYDTILDLMQFYEFLEGI